MSGIVLDNVNFGYSGTRCLESVGFHLDKGGFYGLIGPNGSGKSTLLDLISGYLQPQSGSVMLDGRAVSRYRRSSLANLLTLVPQAVTFNFDFSVYDTVLMGRHPHIGRFSRPSNDDHEYVQNALEMLEITRLSHRSIRQLSGGEKQRVTIARALAQDTEYILLDEGTANLDINHSISIMKSLKDLSTGGKTILAALHDLNMALAFCDSVIVLRDGQVHQFGKTEEVINSDLIADIYNVSADLVEREHGDRQLFYRYSH